jgi:hypothetical protein
MPIWPLKRAAVAGLTRYQDRQPVLLKPQLREFVLFGAKYAFPAVTGRLTRGVVTAYAAAPLNAVIAPSSDPPPVWPHKNGNTRGVRSSRRLRIAARLTCSQAMIWRTSST